MNKILSFVGSMKTMVLLMLIFAFSIGYATIVENDYGTMTAKAEIYNARWFEGLLALLALNLIYNIFKYKMYTIKKAPIFIFHVAFLVILLGAATTRFIGYEGTMHIREGDASSSILSSAPYLVIKASGSDEKKEYSKILYLSKRGGNSFETTLKVGNKNVDVKLLKYIPNATENLVADKNGKAIAKFMITGGEKGRPAAITQGQYYDAGNLVLDFNSSKSFNKPVISLFVKDGKLFMKHDMKLSFLKMADRSQGSLVANDNEAVHARTLYRTDLGGFVLRQFMPHATEKIVSDTTRGGMRMNKSGVNALRFLVNVDKQTSKTLIYAKEGVPGEPAIVNLDGVNVSVAYGSIDIPIPFQIKLKDFQLDRYPGSMSPASYASEVELIDKSKGVDMPYRIYMNHVLDYRNFRFYQASYDRDEKGSVLSVNNDPGTLPSYVGYFLLAVGLFWSLFSKKHRFAKLAKIAKDASEAKIVPALLMLGLLFSVTPSKATELDPAVKTILSFDKNHAQKFGDLIVQDTQGRMKPIDTLSREVLAKIHSSASLQVGSHSLTADQVILGMMIRPDIYKNVKMIRTHNPSINEAIGAPKDATYVSFAQFFQDPENMRGYKLTKLAEDATRKAPIHRDRLDKAVIKIDEKVNVVYMVFTGSLLRIWPLESDASHKWYATIDALQKFDPATGEKVRQAAITYFTAVDASLTSGKWKASDDALVKIADYQKKYGAAVYPSANRIKAELFYNKSNVFEILWPLYFIMGFVLLILSFVKIIYPKFGMNMITKGSLALLVLFFLAHTMGLALRAYISGHAPWSNGFESMTYIAWATVLAGFLFSKRSPITLASTSILAGLILFVAHLSWMSPQITNLVPVLNSYWLDIHVSMITASYGFLALGALLGFVTLILFILKTDKNEKQISLSIKELNAINEMSLMVGLVLLSVGNFLGGVWANESWGRYWSWDPKETWALVSILVYAVVVHLRFIKSIYKEFNYSVISVVAFTSVLMTYFGVNYYLAGMHSYAKGDPVPIPDFVPMTYTVLFLTIAIATMRDLKFNRESIKNHLVIGFLLFIGQFGIFYATYTSGKPIYVLIFSMIVALFIMFGFLYIAMQKKYKNVS